MTVSKIFLERNLFAEGEITCSAGELLCPRTDTHAPTRSLITLAAFVKITPRQADKSGKLLQVAYRLYYSLVFLADYLLLGFLKVIIRCTEIDTFAVEVVKYPLTYNLNMS
jgi:hypothetical protein